MAKILLTGDALAAMYSAIGATAGTDPYTTELWWTLRVLQEPKRYRATARPSIAVLPLRTYAQHRGSTLEQAQLAEWGSVRAFRPQRRTP